MLTIFGTIGAGPNAAIQVYLNGRKVPQLIYAGAARLPIR